MDSSPSRSVSWLGTPPPPQHRPPTAEQVGAPPPPASMQAENGSICVGQKVVVKEGGVANCHEGKKRQVCYRSRFRFVLIYFVESGRFQRVLFVGLERAVGLHWPFVNIRELFRHTDRRATLKERSVCTDPFSTFENSIPCDPSGGRRGVRWRLGGRHARWR